MTAILAVAVFARVWHINSLGYNSDEAVYVGQAGALAGIQDIKDLFPAFRAHPLLVQVLVSLIQKFSTSDMFPRLLAAILGVGTVYITYKIGKLLYGPTTGLFASLFLAVMPYHVVVSRQILLDGPMVFFTTICLYCLAQFSQTKRRRWLYATAVSLGFAFLAKETSIVLLGAVYAFLALSPSLPLRITDIVSSLGVFALTILPFPAAVLLAGRTEGGIDFLTWQLLRRPNHTWDFYLSNVPSALGPLLVLMATVAFLDLRRNRAWPDLLLATWILVPCAFFQVWQVKGFQYLLPIAPALALFAGKAVWKLSSWRAGASWERYGPSLSFVVAGILALTLAFGSYRSIASTSSYSGLAGTGGVPGGREAGDWVAANAPVGSTVMTIGPSMANIIQFYGHRKALGLAISPNPLRRNPSYDPIINPDASLRTGDINYIVWDAFSARRSSFFSNKVLSYADRYHGRIVHSQSTTWDTPDGKKTSPVIVIYEVRP